MLKLSFLFQSCGSNIVTNSSGEIALSSAARVTADECSWTITADNPSKRVSLTITQLNLQRFSSDIFCDLKLEIYEGVDRNGSLRTSFCNNKLPPTIVSHGNSLFVGFTSDMPYSLGHVFFAAHYSVLDNGEFIFNFTIYLAF
jgi:CUB domain